MPVTTGMKGEGFYDQTFFAAIRRDLDSPTLARGGGWRDDMAGLAEPDRRRRLCLLGGANSIAAMQQIANAIREQTSRPIQVVHSDLHTNNFNQLFINLASAGSAERAAAQN